MKDIYGQKNAAPLTTPLRPYNLKGNEEERRERLRAWAFQMILDSENSAKRHEEKK